MLVTDAQPDTASLVWEAARWLEHDAPPLVLLVNKVDRSSRLDVGALERTIPFARGLVEVPNDRAGAAEQLLASRFSWDYGWREPLRELAALLIADWSGSTSPPRSERHPPQQGLAGARGADRQLEAVNLLALGYALSRASVAGVNGRVR